MLTFEEARERLLAIAAPAASERLPLSSCGGRVLAEELKAAHDWPPFDASAMDGYAVRASDVAEGVSLPINGESRTGSPSGEAMAAHTTCRIFTGAVVPEGADCVVMQEDVVARSGVATFSRVPRIGQHVRSRGEDLRSGQTAITAATRLGPAHLSLAATLDRRDLLVAKRPRVAVLATGDELRDPGTSGAPGSIPESNGLAIAEMIARAGGLAIVRPRVGDVLEDVTAAIAGALEHCDVLVSIGGVSVGDHDVVRPALEAAGVTLDFWKVAIKPGKPLCVGRAGDKIVLGLPGNPASAMVTFALFGVPLLRKLQGDRATWPQPMRATLAHDHTRSPGRLEFARARIDGAEVSLVRHQASGAALGVANANALALIEPDRTELRRGEVIEIIPFSELCLGQKSN